MLTLPFLYWFYGSFQGTLGAEPIVRINTQSGYVTLWLLLINLLLGVMLWYSKKWPQSLRWIFSERRALGIASGIYAILHFLTYLGKESFAPKAFEQILDKNYLTVAMLALLILMILLFTSNDFSVRTLGIKRWKNLHRLVYPAGFLILFHVFWIEKANLTLLAAMTAPVVALELIRFFKGRKLFVKPDPNSKE